MHARGERIQHGKPRVNYYFNNVAENTCGAIIQSKSACSLSSITFLHPKAMTSKKIGNTDNYYSILEMQCIKCKLNAPFSFMISCDNSTRIFCTFRSYKPFCVTIAGEIKQDTESNVINVWTSCAFQSGMVVFCKLICL